jgi:hypothetical protein
MRRFLITDYFGRGFSGIVRVVWLGGSRPFYVNLP